MLFLNAIVLVFQSPSNIFALCQLLRSLVVITCFLRLDFSHFPKTTCSCINWRPLLTEKSMLRQSVQPWYSTGNRTCSLSLSLVHLFQFSLTFLTSLATSLSPYLSLSFSHHYYTAFQDATAFSRCCVHSNISNLFVKNYTTSRQGNLHNILKFIVPCTMPPLICKQSSGSYYLAKDEFLLAKNDALPCTTKSALIPVQHLTSDSVDLAVNLFAMHLHTIHQLTFTGASTFFAGLRIHSR